METWMIVCLVVACWWAVGVAGMCCDWLRKFGELDLEFVLLAVFLFWIHGPIYLVTPFIRRMTGGKPWRQVILYRGKGCWK